MLCEICRKQHALQARRVDRGYGEEKLAVCDECARRVDMEQANISFADVFWGAERRIVKCAVCGTTLDEIKRTKYVGCSECYKIFAETIEGLTSSIHGKSVHVGRMPLSVSNRIDKAPMASSLMKRALEVGSFDMASVARSHFPTRRGSE